MVQPYFDDGKGIQIYHGDCLAVASHLDLSAVSMTLTDPPYNVGKRYLNDHDRRDDYGAWCAQWFPLCPRPLVFTPGIANVALWCRLEPPTWLCAWYKANGTGHGGLGGTTVWEPLMVYGKPGHRVNIDAWNVPCTKQNHTGDHPVPRSLRLWSLVLAAFHRGDGAVFDPFLGSGTTLVAARKLGIPGIGIEVEERYCEIAARRLQQQAFDFDDGKEGYRHTIGYTDGV